MDVSQRAHDAEFGEDGPSESESAAYVAKLEARIERLLGTCRDALQTFERRFPDSPTTADLRAALEGES